MEESLQFRHFLLVSGYAKRTIESCLAYVDSFLAQNEFSHETVVEYIANLKERGVSNNTINRYLAHLKAYARYVNDSSILEIKFLKVEQNFTKRILTDDVVEKFLAIPCSKFENKKIYEKNKFFWVIALYCGLRMSEISALKVADFDFDHWEINVTQTKTYMSRKVPIAKTIQDYVYSYVTKCDPDKPVAYMSPSAWRKSFERRLKRIGVEKVHGLSPYSMRHTAGTALVKSAGVIQASRILGHRKLSTTEQYVHLDTQALHDAINSMSYAQKTLSPKEKIDIFLRDVVKAFFWDESEFDINIQKTEGELKLKVKAKGAY